MHFHSNAIFDVHSPSQFKWNENHYFRFIELGQHLCNNSRKANSAFHLDSIQQQNPPKSNSFFSRNNLIHKWTNKPTTKKKPVENFLKISDSIQSAINHKQKFKHIFQQHFSNYSILKWHSQLLDVRRACMFCVAHSYYRQFESIERLLVFRCLCLYFHQ